MLQLLAACSAAAASYGECQPKDGVYRHQPQYHVIAPLFARNGSALRWPGGVNDANAVFERAGVFHIMHQCDGGPPGVPCGGGHEGPAGADRPAGEQVWWHTWGHVVSRDLVRWQRVRDALTPEAANYEHGADCDGTVSFVASAAGGGTAPVMLFGPGCDFKKGTEGAARRGRRRLDTAAVGVARPANASDPLLLDWVKDAANPVRFDGAPCSFAGTLWRSSNASGGGTWNMVCAAGGQWARYTTDDDALHGPWAMADPSFAGGLGGRSGPAFFPLGAAAAGGGDAGGGDAGSSSPTHVVSDGSGAAYSAGTVDADGTKFLPLENGSFQVDFGRLGWTAAGVAASDGRLLLTGWVAGGNDAAAQAAGCPAVKGIAVCGVQAESLVRVLSWERATRRLISYPPHELAGLRNGTLWNHSAAVPRGANLSLTHAAGTAMDLVVRFGLPGAPPAVPFTLGASVFAAADGTGGTELTVLVAAAGGGMAATLQIGGNSNKTTFPILAGERTLELRALVDRSIVEWFVGGGRAVKTDRAYLEGSHAAVFCSGGGGVTSVDVTAFDMGCGWVGQS